MTQENKYDNFLIDNKFVDSLLSLGMTIFEIEHFIKKLDGTGREKNQKIEKTRSSETKKKKKKKVFREYPILKF